MCCMPVVIPQEHERSLIFFVSEISFIFMLTLTLVAFLKILFRLQCTQEHVLIIFFFLNLRVKFQPVEKFGDFFREAASLAMHNIHLSATFPLHTFFSLFHGYTEIWIMTSPVQSLQAALLPVITSSGPFLES